METEILLIVVFLPILLIYFVGRYFYNRSYYKSLEETMKLQQEVDKETGVLINRLNLIHLNRRLEKEGKPLVHPELMYPEED